MAFRQSLKAMSIVNSIHLDTCDKIGQLSTLFVEGVANGSDKNLQSFAVFDLVVKRRQVQVVSPNLLLLAPHILAKPFKAFCYNPIGLEDRVWWRFGEAIS